MAIKKNDLGQVVQVTVPNENHGHPPRLTPPIMGDIFPNWFYFKEVGRNRSCFSRYVENVDDFWKYVSNHLMSSEVEFQFNSCENRGWLVVGALRVVGTFYIIDDRYLHGRL